MQTVLTTRPSQDVIAAIQQLELDSVKARLMDPELGKGWSREYADGIESAYKTYLTMLVKYPDSAEAILLSKDVDEFWHTHILQTRKYARDCENTFGGYLHHEPHVGEVTADDLAKRESMALTTRQLYEREFGGAAEAEAAWSAAGAPVPVEREAAFSSASISARESAFSSAAIGERNAAFSSAAIREQNAAFSSAAIREGNAAFSSAAIRQENAAFSSAAIAAKNAAFSSAAIREGNAAFSSAAIRQENAAFSSAAITAKNAAFSSAAIQAGNAAFSSASIEPASAAFSSASVRPA